MKIVLVDTLCSGHHALYIKTLAKALSEEGHAVTVFYPNPLDIPQEELISSRKIIEPQKITFPIRRFQKTLDTLMRWFHLSKIIKDLEVQENIKFDFVFFAYMDNFIAPYLTSWMIDVIFGYQWSGLYFQPFHFRIQPNFPRLRHVFFDSSAIFHSARCFAVAILDEGVVQKLQKKLQKPIMVFPDFTDVSLNNSSVENSLVEQIRKISRGRKVIGLVGSLERRKGVVTLMRTAKKAIYESFFFVFVGKLEEKTLNYSEQKEFLEFYHSSPDNCFFHLSWLDSEGELNAIIRECDILFTAYENFYGSSNILTKAAYFEKLAIVSKKFCMEERVTYFRTGISIESGSIDECLSAIHTLLSQDCYKKFSPNFRGFRDAHSIERLYDSLRELISCFQRPAE